MLSVASCAGVVPAMSTAAARGFEFGDVYALGLLFAGIVAHGRVAMLRAGLAGEEDKLLGAVKVVVDVDDEFEAGPVQVFEPEVRHFDAGALGGRERDAGVGQHPRRPLLRGFDLCLR